MRTTLTVITLVFVLTAFVALAAWVPVIKDRYKGTNASVSYATRLLFQMSDFAKIWWWALLPVTLLAAVALGGWVGREQERD